MSPASASDNTLGFVLDVEKLFGPVGTGFLDAKAVFRFSADANWSREPIARTGREKRIDWRALFRRDKKSKTGHKQAHANQLPP